MRARRGFTLAELLISMVLLMVITGAAVQFLRKQSNLVSRESMRMDAMQNAQFAGSVMERELREAGAGTSDQQPMLVQLDSEALTFNANMVSVDSGDVRAVYQLSDADTNGTRTMLKTERMQLPNSSPARSYPDSTYYWAPGVLSGAETISYFFRPDSTQGVAKRYLLFRRVNALAPTLVARGIIKDATATRDTMPFFTYFKTDTFNRLVAVPRTMLPLYHNMIHGAQDDTGRFALTDSIRAVKLHFITTTRDPKTGQDNYRTVETLVRMMNSGLVDRLSCGLPPYSPSNVVATSSPAASVTKYVTLTWTASSDDSGGETDIERYAIFRRLSAASAFGDPVSSIPGSKHATYTYTDYQVVAGNTYVYGVAAQDCSPALSAAVSGTAVTVLP